MEHTLIGKDLSIQKIRELIQMASDTALNVLITGETGTGKDVVAHMLHQASGRNNNNFIKVNCAAIPSTLLESELFGYEKGAFTGAVQFKPGKFELASEGVIFLDEIGDMPFILQTKLLEVLQSGEFARLGGTRDIKVDSWVIAATNHDLLNDMKLGLFREDLFYRLNIIKIEIPPLRERANDIPILSKYFIRKYRQDFNLDKHPDLNGDLEDLFKLYHWPGNVRELASVILRLMVGDEPELIKSELLNNMETDGYTLPMEFMQISPDKQESVDERSSSPEALIPLKDLKAEATRFIEKKTIMHALNMTGWNKTETARLLKISYKTLFYKMANAGIEKN